MIKSKEYTGKNEELAIQSALQELGLERDDVSVEVVARAKNGFLGIGSQPARVRVSYEVPDEPEISEAVSVKDPVEEVPAKVEESPAVNAEAAETEKTEEEVVSVPEADRNDAYEEGSVEEKINRFLTGLLAHMGSDATITIQLEESGAYQVELIGENLGSLIGHRGETLDAIQQLTNYSVNRGQNHRVRIHLDAENYRAKREESLQRLARNKAAKVVKNRRNFTLEPMNAYERHVIHTALQDYKNVTTYSIGTEPNRRIVIAYSSGERYNHFA